ATALVAAAFFRLTFRTRGFRLRLFIGRSFQGVFPGEEFETGGRGACQRARPGRVEGDFGAFFRL
ncbi:MAG: hypothetical protein IJM54_10270, partial [Thermoguttaceae bacterium]|nr:hypothetical protein [Thermoguttaceae bacterium]